jgi:hypothetical protein
MKKQVKDQNITTQMGIRLPLSMRRWLEEQAPKREFRSPQELLLDIVRREKEASEQQAA